MTDPIIGATVQVLLEKALSTAIQPIVRALGFKQDVQYLIRLLEMMKAFLNDAEQKKAQRQTVELWLKRVRDLAYEAEDLLDELDYERHRREVEDQGRKVCFFSCFSNPFVFRSRMACKISDMNVRLREINQEAKDYGLHYSLQQSKQILSLNFRESISSGQPKIVGREKNASDIVKMLITSSSDNAVNIIPIVGMGGIGKTTLAQYVFSDPCVVRHFDKRIWTCVSDNFGAVHIFKLVLKSLNQKVDAYETKEDLIKKLQEAMQRSRFLLVLDDVWSENLMEWEDLKMCLKEINTTKGNGVIVTTRILQVASRGSLPHYHHDLQKLSDEDCWAIIETKAFDDGAITFLDQERDFKGIGMKIAQRCQGLPLTANIVGALLHGKEISEWLSMLNNKLSSLGEGLAGVKQILKLSFDHLPYASMKKCFAYCSMFPKDSILQKHELIELWMAEGLLQSNARNNVDMESFGSGVFDYLLQSSLLQESASDKFGNIKNCKMHDLVHDLAQDVLGHDSFLLDDESQDEISQVRYLSLISSKRQMHDITSDNVQYVRSLLSDNGEYLSFLPNFTSLRALYLVKTQNLEVLPESIGKLMHLRYLNVSKTALKALPASVCKLYNLQTLSMNECNFLEELPINLSNLMNLRHIHFWPSKSFKMPPSMGRLTCLRTLPFYNVGKIETECDMKELGPLRYLQGELWINNLELVSGEEQAQSANLIGKSDLLKLKLNWHGMRSLEEENNDESVLEGLKLHPNLKSLRVYGYMGSKFPSWLMDMVNLTEIELENCIKCSEIPTLGELPFLQDLTLWGLDSLGSIGTSFYCSSSRNSISIFPSLKSLRIEGLQNLVEWGEGWTGFGWAKVFPQLEELRIWRCPKLASAPPSHYFPRLKNLEIGVIESAQPLAAICQKISTLTTLEIWKIEQLTYLPEGLLQNNQNLSTLDIRGCLNLTGIAARDSKCSSSLKEMFIEECNRLIELPSELLECLNSLERLRLWKCSAIKSVGIPSGAKGLKSLRHLCISSCKALLRLPSELLECRSSLEHLDITLCDNLMCFPLPTPMVKDDHHLQQQVQLPSLTELGIYGNPKMRSLPRGLGSLCPSLMELTIHGGSWSEAEWKDTFHFQASLDDFLGELSSSSQLERLILFGRPEWDSLPCQLQHLSRLRYLRIESFEGVKTLPDWLGNISSLEEMHIMSCKRLHSLPSIEAFRRLTKLKLLHIENCPILKERCSNNNHPDSQWPIISHLPTIQIDDSRVKG